MPESVEVPDRGATWEGAIRTVAVIVLVILSLIAVSAGQPVNNIARTSPELALLQSGPQIAQLATGMLESRAMAKPGSWYFDLSAGGSVFTGRRDFNFGVELGPGFTPKLRDLAYDVNSAGASTGATKNQGTVGEVRSG